MKQKKNKKKSPEQLEYERLQIDKYGTFMENLRAIRSKARILADK